MPENPGNGEGSDALVNLEPQRQRQAVKLVEEGKAPTSLEARRLLMPDASQPPSKQDEVNRQAQAIIDAWERACPVARDIALQHINRPHLRVLT